MISVPARVRVYLAMGATDMRKGMDGLAMLAQQVLQLDPFTGHLFGFRSRHGLSALVSTCPSFGLIQSSAPEDAAALLD